MAAAKPRTILLRSGWQTVNIGDIAHTPGVLHLLEQWAPEARVILWPASGLDRGVEPMLRRRFPSLEIVTGDIGTMFERADLMLHGSGPSVVARRQLAQWRQTTGKPYALLGVTIETIDDELRDLLAGAGFVGCRETRSVENATRAGVSPEKVAFTPDGTFAFDLSEEAGAGEYLAEIGLEPGFLVAVPRLRYTPYHRIKPGWGTPEEIARREAVNAEFAEVDHAKLRRVIVRWVRATGRRVLVCPEMTYQTEIIGPLVIDPLPDDVKPAVIGRDDYWLPDLAASVYRRAAAVVSFECHSPILGFVGGVPPFYLRQPTDTIKGRMWRDLGFDAWTFEIEDTDGDAIAEALLGVIGDPAAAAARLAAARAIADEAYAAAAGHIVG